MMANITAEQDTENTNYRTYDYLKSLITEQSKLLKEAVDFMNKVPNNKYGDNYKICNKITKILNN